VTGHVFISYRHEDPDKSYVERLVAFLAAEGFEAWHDQDIVTGASWDKVIEERIRTCAAFVVIMTPEADASPWVSRELARAEALGKPILPLLLRGEPFFRLLNLQYHDVRDGQMPDGRFLRAAHDLTGTAVVVLPADPTRDVLLPPTEAVPRDVPAPAREAPLVTFGALTGARKQTGPGLATAEPTDTPVDAPLDTTAETPTAAPKPVFPSSRGPWPYLGFGAFLVVVLVASVVLSFMITAPTGIHMRLLATVPSQPGLVDALAYSPDGQTLYTAQDDGTVTVWDDTGVTPTVVTSLTAGTAPVLAITLSPDGKTLITASADGIKLWDVKAAQNPTAKGTLAESSGPISALALSPDGQTLAAGGTDGVLRLWDLPDLHSPIPEFTVRNLTQIYALAYSGDGHTLAIGGQDNQVSLWNVTRPAEVSFIANLSGHTGSVLALAFTPDGRWLASGSDDHSARLWNVDDPTHASLAATLTVHSGPVEALAFSPNGHILATGSTDHTVAVFDVTDPSHPQPAATLTGHTTALRSLVFSPDRTTLASASADSTRIWEMT
jgi:hypothetical protein